ncbi:hypothetical protein IWW50_004143, partial [Coemansia erecta]
LSDELNQRQLILIPLNHRSHWSLLVYCRLTRTFYHYDSISKHNRNFAERAAGRFLRVLEPRLKEGFYFKSMQTPQQNNDYDCGIYVLAIAEELARRFINNKRKNSRDKRASAHVRVEHRQQSVPPKLQDEHRRDTRTMPPSMSASHVQQLQQRRNHSTPPTARVPVAASLPSSPGRALASDLLMPNFGKPFAGFHSPFAMYDYSPPEPLLKGGGSSSADPDASKSQSKSSSHRSREQRVKMEEAMMEKAGLPRDFWLVTVEDIEYPHCMRRRIRTLVLDLQRQQTRHKSNNTRH